ncbi:N-acetylmuramoyl-L-alanine amidase [Roseibaca sp. V10]|uniref:N-acetylmuramoyl-L-alanine amidase n=1 Tax=Roseinatronobacter domitianus TaxID=2940293 RepID=A0ABT0LYN8_9RHOB|nr:N-acetylmuramoyl-L-alanine amidase [Roseibaca domitiana]MCL1627458.1 N-acetylmuramoyl-L-alanine amidase [Roseibaca domitiana]
MARLRGVILSGFFLLLGAGGVLAQGGVQARVDPAASMLTATDTGMTLRLSLSQPVPYRLRLLPNPPRLVMEFNTLDWQGLDWPAVDGLRGFRAGHRGDGWARMVLDLGFPMLPEVVAQNVDPENGRAEVTVDLRRATLEAFETRAADEAEFVALYSDHLLHPVAQTSASVDVSRPLRIMLDPGHGGLDPGAVRDGQSEAAIVLGFARVLREELLRQGGFEVHMTRDADLFVSLDGRLRAARDVQADLFLSLHADALPEGLATGAVVYTLSEDASDQTAEILAARHDRGDLLAGVDLSRNTDEIASVLMSVAWQDTRLRNAALADALVEGIGAAGLRLHSRPVQSGAFSVLRAPDMPSVLLELGFMSSPRDLARLQDPEWRSMMARAVADALASWRVRDSARRALLQR